MKKKGADGVEMKSRAREMSGHRCYIGGRGNGMGHLTGSSEET